MAKIDNQGLSNAITDIIMALIPTINIGIAVRILIIVFILKNIRNNNYL